jgi:hypothetical protein
MSPWLPSALVLLCHLSHFLLPYPVELETVTPKMWVRFRFLMARRRAGEGLPAPPLPTLSAEGEDSPPSPQIGEQHQPQRKKRQRYPAFDIYYTREENMARMQQRRGSYGVFPPSVVRKAWAKLQESKGASA